MATVQPNPVAQPPQTVAETLGKYLTSQKAPLKPLETNVSAAGQGAAAGAGAGVTATAEINLTGAQASAPAAAVAAPVSLKGTPPPLPKSRPKGKKSPAPASAVAVKPAEQPVVVVHGNSQQIADVLNLGGNPTAPVVSVYPQVTAGQETVPMKKREQRMPESEVPATIIVDGVSHSTGLTYTGLNQQALPHRTLTRRTTRSKKVSCKLSLSPKAKTALKVILALAVLAGIAAGTAMFAKHVLDIESKNTQAYAGAAGGATAALLGAAGYAAYRGISGCMAKRAARRVAVQPALVPDTAFTSMAGPSATAVA